MPLPSMPTWAQTKTGAKTGFDKVYTFVDKLGPHVNKLSNKVGAEAFWPTTLDKESDKAARILRSFCKDGFYVEEKTEESEGEKGKGKEKDKDVESDWDDVDVQSKDNKQQQSPPKQEGVPRGKQRVIKKIPTSVIKNAKGLAIFTTMRTGLWFSGSGGSGILVARLPSGEWSPPSGIMLHTAGLGFLIGVDIYDCVVVINTEKALEAFSKVRCTLGGEVSATAGPVGVGGVMETELHKRQAPVWNYLKSRGFYAGAQVDGTIIIERTDENERFYGERIPVADILAGKAKRPPKEIQGLLNTIRAAQGDADIDESTLPASGPTPGDFQLQEGKGGTPVPVTFGLPHDDDPDQFGVRALEEQGLEIREAGTGSRPSMEAFAYKPSPSSPIFGASSQEGGDQGRRSGDRARGDRESVGSGGSGSGSGSGRGTFAREHVDGGGRRRLPPPVLPPRSSGVAGKAKSEEEQEGRSNEVEDEVENKGVEDKGVEDKAEEEDEEAEQKDKNDEKEVKKQDEKREEDEAHETSSSSTSTYDDVSEKQRDENEEDMGEQVSHPTKGKTET